MDVEGALKVLTTCKEHGCDCMNCDFCNSEINPILEATEVAIEALLKIKDYETQWVSDMSNPLEPIKVKSALDGELFKLNYRKEHDPKSISILDYTIIYALSKVLVESIGEEE